MRIKKLEHRLQFHFEGQVLEGVKVDGKITRTESYQTTPVRGFNSRNISIKALDPKVLDPIIARVDELRVKYQHHAECLDQLNKQLSQAEHSADAQLIEHKRALEKQLGTLKEQLSLVDQHIAELREGARYGIRHGAIIHETIEELNRPLRLTSVTGHFLDDLEVDLFSTILYEDILNLKLVDNKIGSKGAISLFEKLARNSTLRVLNLASNNVDDAAMQVFAKNIATNTTLRAVSFAKNPLITSACVPALREALSQNKTLYKISLAGTGLTTAEIKSLTELAAKNAPKERTPSSRPTYLSNWWASSPSPEKTPLVKSTTDIPLETIDDLSFK